MVQCLFGKPLREKDCGGQAQAQASLRELELGVKERTIDSENVNTALNKRTIEIQEALEKLRSTQDQLIQRDVKCYHQCSTSNQDERKRFSRNH